MPSFVTVVEIPKPRQPASRQRPLVHDIAVILGRDVAAGCADHDTGLILAAVSELELVGVGNGGERHDLTTETDGENWTPVRLHAPHVIGRRDTPLGIARAAGDHEAVEAPATTSPTTWISPDLN